MTNPKVSKDASFVPAVVSPTQDQMDKWVEEELAQASDIQMLGDDSPQALFDEPQSPSLD